jgi:hypothetical protein
VAAVLAALLLALGALALGAGLLASYGGLTRLYGDTNRDQAPGFLPPVDSSLTATAVANVGALSSATPTPTATPTPGTTGTPVGTTTATSAASPGLTPTANAQTGIYYLALERMGHLAISRQLSAVSCQLSVCAARAEFMTARIAQAIGLPLKADS